MMNAHAQDGRRIITLDELVMHEEHKCKQVILHIKQHDDEWTGNLDEGEDHNQTQSTLNMCYLLVNIYRANQAEPKEIPLNQDLILVKDTTGQQIIVPTSVSYSPYWQLRHYHYKISRQLQRIEIGDELIVGIGWTGSYYDGAQNLLHATPEETESIGLASRLKKYSCEYKPNLAGIVGDLQILLENHDPIWRPE